MEKIYGVHKLVGLQLFWSRTPTFSSGTPSFCQMGVLNSCFQNPIESSADLFSRMLQQFTVKSLMFDILGNSIWFDLSAPVWLSLTEDFPDLSDTEALRRLLVYSGLNARFECTESIVASNSLSG